MRPLPCFQNGNLQNKSLGIFAGNPRQIFLKFFRSEIIWNFSEPPVPPILQLKNCFLKTQNYRKKSDADFNEILFSCLRRLGAIPPYNLRCD